jgi:hypothetical protein
MAFEEIALRYGDHTLDLDGDPFTEPLVQTGQMGFRTVDARHPRYINNRESGRMLNGRGYSHLLSKYKRHQITIGADEAEYYTVIPFLEAFWNAPRKYISRWNGNSWDSYIEVMADGQEFPLTEMNDDYYLPEITFNLIEVNNGL